MLKRELNVLPGMRNIITDVTQRKYGNVLSFGRITKSQRKMRLW
jgi:hypothetical protein